MHRVLSTAVGNIAREKRRENREKISCALGGDEKLNR